MGKGNGENSTPIQAAKVIDDMTGLLRDQAEGIIPTEVRGKLVLPFRKRLLVLVGYMVLGTLLGWRMGWSVLGWWVGGLLGYHLLDVDHLLDVFFLHPETDDSHQVKQALKSRNWKIVWQVLIKTAPQRTKLVLHSVIFEVVLMFLVIYVVTSKGGLFAAGLVLSFWLRMLYEQVSEFMKTGKMDKWFWQIKDQVPSNLQAVFLIAGMVVWVVLSMAVF
jgi:hypothetical protein